MRCEPCSYPTEGSGKTCKEIKETAHTLGGYLGHEPIGTQHKIFLPRRNVFTQHLLYVKVYQTFRYR